jgi:bifunctional non-homologous end joining protein LigD
VPRFRFSELCQPVLRDRPPKGADWIHEVKFDGYRVQIHKQGEATGVLSRNGFDFTSRYPTIARALAAIPAKSVISDGELVASSIEGIPEFYALHFRAKRLAPGRLCV